MRKSRERDQHILCICLITACYISISYSYHDIDEYRKIHHRKKKEAILRNIKNKKELVIQENKLFKVVKMFDFNDGSATEN